MQRPVPGHASPDASGAKHLPRRWTTKAIRWSPFRRSRHQESTRCYRTILRLVRGTGEPEVSRNLIRLLSDVNCSTVIERPSYLGLSSTLCRCFDGFGPRISKGLCTAMITATDGWRRWLEFCGDSRAGDGQYLISSKPQSKDAEDAPLAARTYENGASSLIEPYSTLVP